MKKMDPITLEVMRNALYSITDEMSAALVRTAYSTNIKDRRDCSCAFYTHDGKVVAQSEVGTPLHLGVMPKVIGTILKKFPIENMEPGDQYIMNTPYPAGPGHLNDITIMSPIHYGDIVVALVANQAHHVDVGGFAPGSMPFGVTEIYQEGLQIPPTKIFSRNKPVQDIIDFIQVNVRTPDAFIGDAMAQVAGNNVGKKRVIEMLHKYGSEEVLFYMAEIMNYSERRMLSGIKSLPKGVYEFEDYLEGSGVDINLIKIKAKVEICKDKIIVDFTGTDPQVKGPVNCRKPTAEACVYYVMKCIIDPGLPPNDGAYRPIEVIVEDGSLLSATFPSSVVHSNIVTTQRIVDVLFGALFKAVPKRVCAACSGTENIVIIGGTHPKTNKPFSYVETYGGGQGALFMQDGMSGVHTHMTNTRNAPVEIIEHTYPLLVKRYGLVPDSEGAGKYRGGFGMVREIETYVDATFTLGTERAILKPWGVYGGLEASTAKCTLVAADGKEEILPSKITRKISKGDTITTITPGGGGWESPKHRDPEKVRWDVLEGLVSVDRAKNVYGIVINDGPVKTKLK
jgi:N-methylhydantoinase B